MFISEEPQLHISYRLFWCIVICYYCIQSQQLRDVDDFFTDDEAYLSYLPLAHAYEQVMAVCIQLAV